MEKVENFQVGLKNVELFIKGNRHPLPLYISQPTNPLLYFVFCEGSYLCTNFLKGLLNGGLECRCISPNLLCSSDIYWGILSLQGVFCTVQTLKC